jgi:hypothetical protein
MYKKRFVLMEGEPGGAASGGAGAGAAPPGQPATAADFRTMIPEEFRADPTLTDIKDVTGLVKGYINAQRMVGMDKVIIPKEGDPAEKWAEAFGKMGRPAEAGGYKFQLPPNLPPDFPADMVLKELAPVFHKANLTQSQAQALAQEIITKEIADYTTGLTERDSQTDAWKGEIKKAWGSEFDQNQAIARNAVATFGGPEMKAFLEESGLGDNPQVANLFLKIGKALGEDKAFREGSATQGFAAGPQQAQMELTRLQGDAAFMKQYLSADDPMHKQAVDRMMNLFKTAYPGKAEA